MHFHLIINIYAGIIRLVLRIYFTIIFLITPFIGDYICRYAVKRRLLHAEAIPLPRMTGWLQGFSLVTTPLSLRTLPSGGIWFLMAFAGILSLASDLMVSSLIPNQYLPARCLFGQGLVIPQTSFDAIVSPPVNGAPYIVTTNAQLNSVANGGLQGIYWKTNDDVAFAAQEVDVLGSWVCNDVNNDITYSVDSASQDVIDDLIQRGMLYTTNIPAADYLTTYSNGGFAHLVVWNTNLGSTVGQTFDVRVSVDQNANNEEAHVMKSYQCSMDASKAEWILTNINTTLAMEQWVVTLQGRMYDGTNTPASNYSTIILEQFLNDMVMIAGGSNYLLGTAEAGTDPTYGCVTEQTLVPESVVVLFLVVTGTFIAMVICVVVLFIQVFFWKHSHGRGDEYTRRVKQHTPGDLAGWMTQAVREGGNAVQGHDTTAVKAKELKRWTFGPMMGTFSGLGVVRPHPGSPLTPSGAGQGYFPKIHP